MYGDSGFARSTLGVEASKIAISEIMVTIVVSEIAVSIAGERVGDYEQDTAEVRSNIII